MDREQGPRDQPTRGEWFSRSTYNRRTWLVENKFLATNLHGSVGFVTNLHEENWLVENKVLVTNQHEESESRDQPTRGPTYTKRVGSRDLPWVWAKAGHALRTTWTTCVCRLLKYF